MGVKDERRFHREMKKSRSKREPKAGNANDGFRHGPRAQGLTNGEAEAIFHDPKTAVIQVGQEERAKPE